MIILSGSIHPDLTRDIAMQLHLPVGEVDRVVFRNGELKPRIITPVKEEDVVIVQPLVYPVHEAIMELLLLIDAAKRSGAKTVTAIVPWLSYSLQNEVFLPGEPLSVEVFAKMVSSVPCSKLILFHLHKDDEINFFSTPTQHLSSMDVLIPEVQRIVGDKVIVAPDKGAYPYAKQFADKAGLECISMEKSRDRNTGKVSILSVSGEVKDKVCIFIDDVINTGGTAADAAKSLKELGASSIMFVATHGLFAGEAPEILQQSMIDTVMVTDSIPVGNRGFSKLKTVSCASIFAQALQ